MRAHYWGSLPCHELSDADRELLPLLSGLVLFRENLQGDTAELVQRVKQLNPDIEIAIDHEGGRVNRFSQTMQLRSAQSYIDSDDEELFKAHLIHDFSYLKALGIDRIFGPCVDINLASQGRPSRVIGELGRSYGSTYDEVGRWAKIYIETAHQCGLKTCLKHFPDHGYCQEDSHIELPQDMRAQEELAPILAFYQKLVQQHEIDMVMLAHFALPNITGHTESITFDASIQKMSPVPTITDCLGMQAISGTPTERISRAQQAGHQHVMLTHQPADVLKRAIEAVNQSLEAADDVVPNQSVGCSF